MKMIKKLALFFFLIVASATTLLSQQYSEDTNRYINYQAQYGQKIPRIWGTQIARMPYGDTANYKPERGAPGAIMMHSTGSIVGWDGYGWRVLQGASTDTASLSNRINQKVNISDTLLMLSSYVRLQRFLDSLSFHNTKINSKLNITDTTVMLSSYVRVARFLDSCSALRVAIVGKASQQALVDSAAAIRSAIGSGGSITPGGPNYSVQYKDPSNIFAGTNKVTIDPSVGRINADSSYSKLFRGDSIKLSRQFFTYLPTGLEGWGDSFVVGSYASPIGDSSFMPIFGRYMGLPVTISALSGTGCYYNIKNFHANVGLSNTRMQVLNVNYNDLRATGANVKTYAKGCNAGKAFFLNHFASVYIDAGGTGVTRYGTWTTGVNATIHAGKSANAAYTTTLNDSIVYSFVGSSVGAAMMGSDGIVSNYASFDVYIDGNFYATYNANNQTDGAVVFANPNHTDSVFCYPILIHSLSSGPHKIKLVNKSATGQRMYADYFTTLAPASTKPPAGIFHILPIQPYYIAFNSKQDSMVATLPPGYPFAQFKIEQDYVESTDMDIDGVHMNNSGHRHYAQTMMRSFSPVAANLPDGILTRDRWLYLTYGGVSNKIAFGSEVWNKSDDKMEVAGDVILPASKSYSLKQGTVISSNFDAILNNARLFGGGNNNLTGQGNYIAMPNAGLNLTSANDNINIGRSACLNCTTGSNISIGPFTNAFTTTGSNVAIGANAIQFSGGTGNVGVGISTLQGNTSFTFNNSTALGNSAGGQNRGSNSIFIGALSGANRPMPAQKMVAIGFNAGFTIAEAASGDVMNINNIIMARGANGQDTSLAGQIGFRTRWYGRNTARVGGSFGITPDSVALKTLFTDQNFALIGKSGTADSGTISQIIYSDAIASISSDVSLKAITSGTSNFTAEANSIITLPSLAGVGSRTITLPSASAFAGKRIIIWNTNMDGTNIWSFSNTYTEPNGTTETSIGSGTLMSFASTGAVWIHTN